MMDELTRPLPKAFHLPPPLRQRCARQLDQQMWCWGRDIQWTTGNLLLNYGFKRIPSPDPRFHSRYEWAGNGVHLALWGFGVWFGRSELGSIFLKRFDFRPLYSDQQHAPDIWKPESLSDGFRAVQPASAGTISSLLTALMHTVAAYETWTLVRMGEPSRLRILEAWPDRRRGCTPPAVVPAEWERLAAQISQLPLSDQEFKSSCAPNAKSPPPSPYLGTGEVTRCERRGTNGK